MKPWERTALSMLLRLAIISFWASKRLEALAGKLASVVTREVIARDLERVKDVLAVYEEHRP